MKQVALHSIAIIILLCLAGCSQRGFKEPCENPTYILNKNTLVYHELDCKYLPDEKNQVEIEYADIEHNPKCRPCGHCLK